MLDTRRHEQQVARAESSTVRAVHEVTFTPDHDVNLVPAVRRLGIDATRGVQLDGQGTVLVGDDERLAFRGRQPAQPGRELTVEAPVRRR